MAKFARAAASIAAIVALTATATSAEWHIAVLIAGDSDLWQLGRRTFATLTGAPVEGIVLLDAPCGMGRSEIARLAGGRGVVAPLTAQNTGDPRLLRRVALGCSRGGFRMLSIVGHGTPPGQWTPGGSSGLAVDFGSGDALTPRELAVALEDSRWDVVVLCTCHSASLEILWALRECAKFAVCISGEPAVAQQGVGKALLAVEGQESARAAAVAVAAQLAKCLTPPSDRPAAVVVVNVKALEKVAKVLQGMTRAAMAHPVVARYALAAAGTMTVPLDDRGSSVDVASLCTALATLLPTSGGGKAASMAAEAARVAVEQVWWIGRRPPSCAAGIEIAAPSAQALRHTGAIAEVPLWRVINWTGLARCVGKSCRQEVGAGQGP